MQPLFDAVVDYLPSPLDVPPIRASIQRAGRRAPPAVRPEPFAMLAMKIVTDPYVGSARLRPRLSGKVETGMTLLNTVKVVESIPPLNIENALPGEALRIRTASSSNVI